ncbi:MAG: hypothetical protein ACUVTD_02130 [Nitrososphaerales archaeon]
MPLRSTVEEDIKILTLAVRKNNIDLEIHDTRPPASLVLAPSYIELIAEMTDAQVYRYD